MALILKSNPVRIIPEIYDLEKITSSLEGKMHIIINSAFVDVSANFIKEDHLLVDNEKYKGYVFVESASFDGTNTIVITTQKYISYDSLGESIKNTTSVKSNINRCNVVAALSQIPYMLQRQDDQVLQVSEDAGKLQVEITGDVTFDYVVGNTIYIENNGYTGHSIVESVEYLAPNTTIKTQSIYTGGTIAGGFINNLSLKFDYKVLISAIDSETNEDMIPPNQPYKFSNEGICFLDLKSLLNSMKYNSLTVNFKLRYKEYYDGLIHNSVDDEDVLLLPAKKQLLSVGGSAMFENLLRTASPHGNYLTKFEEPIYWNGWAKHLSVVIDSYYGFRNVDGENIYGITNHYNVNKINIGNISELPQKIKVGINSFLIDPSISSYYVGLQLLDGQSNENVKEILHLRKDPCENPIMVEWLNELGGFDSWMFSVTQDVQLKAEEGNVFETPINAPIDEENLTINRLSYKNSQTLKCFAEKLSTNQLKVLHYLKVSPLVYVWLNNLGTQKIKAVVKSTLDTEFITRTTLHDYSVKLILPDDFEL